MIESLFHNQYGHCHWDLRERKRIMSRKIKPEYYKIFIFQIRSGNEGNTNKDA